MDVDAVLYIYAPGPSTNERCFVVHFTHPLLESAESATVCVIAVARVSVRLDLPNATCDKKIKYPAENVERVCRKILYFDWLVHDGFMFSL